MRSATLKQIILIISITIGSIILVQLFWLNKQYSFEQKEFTTNVIKGVRGFYEDFGSDVGQQMRDRKSTRLNSSHLRLSRMPSSA